MRQLWMLLVVLCFATGAWTQSGSPWVYVSGTDGSISRVTSAGAVTSLLSASGTAAFEGLVVGPDNADADNPAHPYLLYACDPTHNRIIRFDPENLPAGVETIYQGNSTLQAPQCGRFTNTGDLIVTSKVPGAGTWKFPGIAAVALNTAGLQVPVQVNVPASSTLDEGIAQKNIGDLLIVDSANKDVLRSPYAANPPFSGTPAVFVPASPLLPSPHGIARKSDGEIYVSNEAPGARDVVHFDAQGANGNVCVPSFGPNVSPFFMQMSSHDTLYVATGGPNSGAVYSVNTATCAATPIATEVTLPPLRGIALPPTQVSQTQTFSGTATFNFGFAAYQFTSPSCTLTITATPTNLSAIRSLIGQIVSDDPSDLPFGGTPAVNLGLDGFELLFNVINKDAAGNPAACSPQFTDGTFKQFLAAQVDDLIVSNPRMGRCGTAEDPPLTCGILASLGNYFLGGLLPSDLGISIKGQNCSVFLLNGSLATPTSGQLASFCGFDGAFNGPQPPGIAGRFRSGQTVTAKFRLAQAKGTCKYGPFITNATALLSVAEIFDAKGNPVFNPVAINGSGNPALFTLNSNQQYVFNLSLAGYAPGTYSLTVTFLTSNSPSITVEFQVFI